MHNPDVVVPEATRHEPTNLFTREQYEKQWKAATATEQGAACKAFWAYWDACHHFSTEKRPDFYEMDVRERCAWLKAARTAIGVHERAKMRF